MTERQHRNSHHHGSRNMQHTAHDETAAPELGHHHGTCNMKHTAYDGTATPELSPPMDLQHTKLLMTEQQHWQHVHHQGTCDMENTAYDGRALEH